MKLTKLANSLVAVSVLATTLMLGSSVYAQTQPGKAEVRAIKGTAYYYATQGAAKEMLKKDTILGPGAIVETGPASLVDLFLGNSAGFLRVTENTRLVLDKFTMADTGADTVVEVQLNVPEGTILGNVQKLSSASKYEIKVPNGVAGIRGTEYRISSTGYIVLLQGTMIFVYVAPGGNPVPYTLQSPPPVYFSPIEGVKPAPEDLIMEVRGQLGPGKGSPTPWKWGAPPGQIGKDPATGGHGNPYRP